MTTFNVSTTAGFQSALAQAHAGDSILLASGTYSGISISNVNITGGAVTIASQNAATPAVVTNFSINGSSGLSFSHLDFSATGPTGAAYSFLVNNSQNISYDSLTVHGAIGSTPYNNPSAFYFENSSHVTVTNSSFQYLQVGIIGYKSQYMTYNSNSFKYMGVDGIDDAGVSNVQINNNFFTDFMPGPGAHPDAIQFWTEGTSTSAHDLTITGNVYTRGSGGPLQTQGIFVQDDSGVLPYINVTITGNKIYGGAYNGIYVLQAQNLNVSNNTVAGFSDMESWIYGKGVSGSVNNNSTQEYLLSGNTGLTQSGDLTIGAVAPGSPALANSGAAASYAAGGAAAVIARALSVNDTTSPSISSATVAITGGFKAGDTLNFLNQNGITGSYNASTGVLTLTGKEAQTVYQAALESITYSSSAADPTGGGTDKARTISFSVNDGATGSNTLAATLNVSGSGSGSGSPPTSPPSLSNSGSAVTYTAGGAAADIAHSLGVADTSSTTLASAKVSITGGFLAGDALNFTNQNGISGSYNASTGVLTLSGTASLASYQTALESITYSSSASDPTHAGADMARTVSFSVNDGSQSSNTLAATVSVSAAQAPAPTTPPALSNSGAAVTYVPGGAAADIAHALGVTDASSTTLASAKVSIASGFLAGDALHFTNQSGITGSYNSSTGVLTLSGTAPLASYQTALESITYSSSASDPTHTGTDMSRSVSFTVNDGSQSSSALAATVNVAQHSAPKLTNTGTAVTYTVGGAAVDIAHSLAAADASSATLASARVAITSGFRSGDALHFANQSGISGSYNSSSGVLTLSGTASLAAYQAALDSITYSSSAHNPTHNGNDASRTISFSVNDGTLGSNALAATVNLVRQTGTAAHATTTGMTTTTASPHVQTSTTTTSTPLVSSTLPHSDAFIFGAAASSALSTSTHAAAASIGTASGLGSLALFGTGAGAMSTLGGSHLASDLASLSDLQHLAVSLPLLGGHDLSHVHMSLI